jgi:hypothetical protein
LIAKKSSDSLVQAALEQFCLQAGIADDNCGYHSKEIVIQEGAVVDVILRQAHKKQCDFIIMGGRGGASRRTSIGSDDKGSVAIFQNSSHGRAFQLIFATTTYVHKTGFSILLSEEINNG